MTSILFILYSAGVWLGDVYIYFGRLFSHKLDLLYRGRQKTWAALKDFASNHTNICWIHCASLGEFEQGRPLMEKLHLHHPEISILLSFYSPSGYEIMKHYDKASVVIYIPSDLPSNNKKILSIIKPRIVVFVKYEFWWNLISELIKNNINVYLISGVFRKNDYFFMSVFRPFLNLLSGYKKIFVQDIKSSEILDHHHLHNHQVVGDTRIDRVIQRSKETGIPTNLNDYCRDRTVILYGSIWESDIPLIRELIHNKTSYIHIIAPHDINSGNVNNIRQMLEKPGDLFSDDQWKSNIIIIDNIGMLSGLYKLSRYAYVGGGFQHGIHNILEPAVYGIPVFFGPRHQKFNEALALKNQKLAFTVSKAAELLDMIDFLENNKIAYDEIRQGLNAFFQSNKGATDRIANDIGHLLN
ncbi:MAG: hypothetical protein H7X99_00350 [Saprospiraceae bacterium]|nr:hypothetical protein [Saprospiraceae bacterium]